jgi:hypothetical protein
MEKVEAFRSSDGLLFSNEDSARAHEESLKWGELLERFADSQLCPYPTGTHAAMSRKVILAWEAFKSMPVPEPKESVSLDDSIENLLLTTRSTNCLRSENISTIRELTAQTSHDLLKIPYLGRKCLREITDKLRFYGLSLESA